MTEDTIKKLDDLATREIKRLGIAVRRHEFFISAGEYPGRMDRDVFRIRPREVLHVLAADTEVEDVGPLLALMAQTLYEEYSDEEIDLEPDLDKIFFMSDSACKYMDDLQILWEKGIPARIAYDPDYIMSGHARPEDYCLIDCRCGKLIMVPRYTGDMILEATCPICGLPWEYQNERPHYPYCDGMYGVICDYEPIYKIPK